jgi:hypothetical protein
MQADLSSRNIIGESSELGCEGIAAILSAADRLQVVCGVHDGPSVIRSGPVLGPDLAAEGLLTPHSRTV